MRLERYESKRKGIRALLGSQEVRADLHRRAEAVAAAARADYEGQPPNEGEVEVVVDSSGGDRRRRARAAVVATHPGVLHIEADRRPLGAAMDAARDQ